MNPHSLFLCFALVVTVSVLQGEQAEGIVLPPEGFASSVDSGEVESTGWVLGEPILIQGVISDESGLPLSGGILSISSEGVVLAADGQGVVSGEFTPSSEVLVVDISGPAFPPGTAQAFRLIPRRNLVDLTDPNLVIQTSIVGSGGVPQTKWLLSFSSALQNRAEWISPAFGLMGGSWQSSNGDFTLDVPAGVVEGPCRIAITRIHPAFSSNLDSPYSTSSWIGTELLQVDIVLVDEDWNLIPGPLVSPISVGIKSRGLQDIDGDGAYDGIWGLRYSGIPHTMMRAGAIPATGSAVVQSGSVSFSPDSGRFTFAISKFSIHTASLPPGEGQSTAGASHCLQDNSYEEIEKKCETEYTCGTAAGRCKWSQTKGEEVNHFFDLSADIQTNLKLWAFKAGVDIEIGGGSSWATTASQDILLETGGVSATNPGLSGWHVGEVVTLHTRFDCVGDSSHPGHALFYADNPMYGRTKWWPPLLPDPNYSE